MVRVRRFLVLLIIPLPTPERLAVVLFPAISAALGAGNVGL